MLQAAAFFINYNADIIVVMKCCNVVPIHSFLNSNCWPCELWTFILKCNQCFKMERRRWHVRSLKINENINENLEDVRGLLPVGSIIILHWSQSRKEESCNLTSEHWWWMEEDGKKKNSGTLSILNLISIKRFSTFCFFVSETDV